MIPLTEVFVSEVLGTGVMMAIGTGASANNVLRRTLGHGGGYFMGAFAWGVAVLAGIQVSQRSGAHLNPAVTIGKLLHGDPQFAPNVEVTALSTGVYLGAEVLGAFLGACVAWIAYRQHFAAHDVQVDKLKVFATSPAIRSRVQNTLTEAIATFVLVFVLLSMNKTPQEFGAFATALLVMGIGLGLGGATAWSINPARDFGARLAHAVLPIPGKGSSDWSYGWCAPIVGPFLGAIMAAILSRIV